MAKSKTKRAPRRKLKSLNFKLSSPHKLVLGSFLVITGLLLFIAFVSFLFTGEADQSTLADFASREIKTQNWLSKSGAWLSDFFIQRGFGVASFIFSGLVFLSGIYVLMNINKSKLRRHWFWGIFIIIWLSVLLGFFGNKNDILGGTVGFEINNFLQDYIGKIGTLLILLFGLITYLAIRFKLTFESFTRVFKSAKKDFEDDLSEFNKDSIVSFDNSLSDEAEAIKSAHEISLKTKKPESKPTSNAKIESAPLEVKIPEPEIEEEPELEIKVEAVKEEISETDNLANKLVEDFGQFDPTLELAKYQFPTLDLLKKYDTEGITINQEELEENKNKIVDTLSNYKIGIASIKATIGPTVTLYEIVPDAGVRISKIKNLEDDIALSLSALGIRIIAPIPGKGTIGIEVPNKNATIVSMRSVISSKKFQSSEMQLPIALGKTISNETFVVDLAKMPHLLVAGTTGSGKSVAINTMILSLLYKLTPEECRMIMIDPKMLELSVYDGIPHLLSPVVTDPKKAVVALKWTVGEMEERYRKMSKMGVRNIDGYNGRVKEALAKNEMFSRTVQTGFDEDTGEPIFETDEFTPEVLPYIVVIVDEMADLMMVAGKEIEACIQRLAQMARASGIHLIMATQRPSVDVITGTIKANFPTRISFQVTSKIDSRTILGEMGAEQLLGMGDMLYMAGGGKISRIHGPFCSDEEVEEIVNFLKGFGPPEYMSGVVEGPSDEAGSSIDAVLGLGDGSDVENALYDTAVAIVLKDRKCSTSYIQRKLAIGYNKAARLVEQMEDEGVVSSANHVGKREILVPEQHQQY